MKKLLLIEDDQVVGGIYRNKFQAEGFQVEVAPDGESGIELAKAFVPDVVLLDLMLPKMSGVDLLKEIRALEQFKKIPVIVFSNTFLSNMVQDAWKAGATKCISKAHCTPRHAMDVVWSVFPDHPRAKAAAALTPSAPRAVVKSAAPEAKPPETARNDEEFQAQLQNQFLQSLPSMLITFRSLLQALIKSENDIQRITLLRDLYRRIHALTGNAGIAGMLQIAQMADAMEALVKELCDKPKNITASTLRTVAISVDFLGELFEHAGKNRSLQEAFAANVLVVDDEAISRRAITHALEKAKFKSVSVNGPDEALRLIAEQKFDLIILDVDMPGMTGFELCTRLRGMPAYKKTPVVFVTSLTDFESRANSTISGGNDLIAKPFLFIELAVKTLVFVLRCRLDEIKETAARAAQARHEVHRRDAETQRKE